MFGGRYNLTRFSLPSAAPEIDGAVFIADALKCLVGFGSDIKGTADFADTLHTKSRLSIGLSGSLTGNIGLKQHIYLVVDVNQGIYLEGRFSALLALAADADSHMRFDDFLRCSTQLSLDFPAVCKVGDVLEETVTARADIPGTLSGVLRLSALLTARLDLAVQLPCREELAHSGKMSKDIQARAEWRDKVTVHAIAGKAVSAVFQGTETLKGRAAFVKDLTFTAMFSDEWRCAVKSSVIEVVTLVINGSIPAGKTLVIDSENYTARLDGENILHLVNGDWPFLSEDVLELSVTTANGAVLNGEIEYCERYL